MPNDNDLDRPFDTDRAIEKTWGQANLDVPDEEEIDPEDELEDEKADRLDDSDQLDESDTDEPYEGNPRGGSSRALD